ncbi:MAG: DUF5906 domain-containing protein [Nitrospira sp.]
MNSVEFLKAFHPQGPWVITVINPGQQGERTETETFMPGEEDKLQAYIDKWNGKWNVYFTPNRIGRKMRKKPERTDVEWLDYLHVDVDPRKWSPECGQDKANYLKEEQDRIRDLLTKKLPDGLPPPSVLVFSGGGYQAFWKLTTPIALDGTLETADDMKLWNLQIERLLKADTCHNVDRIMRLPGTWNLPNKKKIEKDGRFKAMSGVVKFERDLSYDISCFTKAPQLQSAPGKSGFSGTDGAEIEVDVNTSNIEQLIDVHDLDQFTSDGLPLEDRVKTIIQKGYDPDDHSLKAKPKGDRSVWVFDAVCAMVRRGIPDQMILATLLDKDFRISDHIYDQKIGAEKYAVRQIKRAKLNSIDPTLVELNDKYALVLIGSKARILAELTEELYKGEPRPVVVYMAPEDFKQLYCNRLVQTGLDSNGNPKFTPLGRWWIEHPNRRQFLDGVHFTPERDQKGKYNLWRGFSIGPASGRNHESFLAHVYENICSGNETWYKYLVSWMAHMIQKPAELASVAVVLRGDPGVGKSFLPNHLGVLLGYHYIHISSSKHLVGNFNAHLQDKLLVFSDEAIWSGDKQSQSTLKTLITERTRIIERKGFDAVSMPNYTRLIMASNDEQVIHAQGHERRYFVLTVSPKHRQDKEYFAQIAKDLEDGGYQNLMAFLMAYDIKDFDPRNYPETEELQRQKVMSLPPHIEWWLNCLQDGKVHPKHDKWEQNCSKEEAFQAYTSYMHSLRINHQLNKTNLLKHLREVLPGLVSGQREVEIIVPTNMEGPEWEPVKQKRRVQCYLLPDLQTARKLFEEKHGPQEWDQST